MIGGLTTGSFPAPMSRHGFMPGRSTSASAYAGRVLSARRQATGAAGPRRLHQDRTAPPAASQNSESRDGNTDAASGDKAAGEATRPAKAAGATAGTGRGLAARVWAARTTP